jgi:hypothetical protein
VIHLGFEIQSYPLNFQPHETFPGYFPVNFFHFKKKNHAVFTIFYHHKNEKLKMSKIKAGQ